MVGEVMVMVVGVVMVALVVTDCAGGDEEQYRSAAYLEGKMNKIQ